MYIKKHLPIKYHLPEYIKNQTNKLMITNTKRMANR